MKPHITVSKQPLCSVLILLSVMLLIVSGCAVQIVPSHLEETADEKVLVEIDSLISSFMKKNHIPGLSLAIVQGDYILVLRGYGEADRDEKIPATPNTIFRAYSLAKTFTALGVVQLINDGKISPDDLVASVLPEWPDYTTNGGKHPTVQQLLTHSAGLPRNSYFHQSSVPITDAMRLHTASLAGSGAVYPAGSRYQYSNVGYNILGRIIEVNTSSSFAFHMKNTVLADYHMHNSTFYLGGLPDSEPVAKGYVYKNYQYDAIPPYDIDQLASGNLFTTAEDLAACMRLLLSKEPEELPISEHTLDMAFSQQNEMVPVSIPMGYGWMISSRFLGETLLYHQGGDYDAAAILTLMPESDTGISILTNTGSYESARLFMLVKELFNAVKETTELDPARESDKTLEQKLPGDAIDSEIAGRYIGYGQLLELDVDDAAMKMKFGPLKMKLHPAYADEIGIVCSASHWLGNNILNAFSPVDLDYLEVIFPYGEKLDTESNSIIIRVSDLSYEVCPRYPQSEEIPDSWKLIAGTYDRCQVTIDSQALYMQSVGYLMETSQYTFTVVGGVFNGEKVVYDPENRTLQHQGIVYKKQ